MNAFHARQLPGTCTGKWAWHWPKRSLGNSSHGNNSKWQVFAPSVDCPYRRRDRCTKLPLLPQLQLQPEHIACVAMQPRDSLPLLPLLLTTPHSCCACVLHSSRSRNQVMNVRVMRSNDLEMKLINRLTRWHSASCGPHSSPRYPCEVEHFADACLQPVWQTTITGLRWHWH